MDPSRKPSQVRSPLTGDAAGRASLHRPSVAIGGLGPLPVIGGGVVAELETLGGDPGVWWFGAWRNINLLVWHRGADKRACARIDATNAARTKAWPQGISTVHILREGAKQPDSETRDAFNAMHAEWGHTVGCAVVVIEQRGFLGVAVRSAVAGMSMVAPKFYRIRVCDTVEAAAPWLSENHARSTDVVISPEDALAVLSAARLRHQ
ncbi:MAG: hypothetical protein ABW252_15480 [Polyangiales bacterium]